MRAFVGKVKSGFTPLGSLTDKRIPKDLKANLKKHLTNQTDFEVNIPVIEGKDDFLKVTVEKISIYPELGGFVGHNIQIYTPTTIHNFRNSVGKAMKQIEKSLKDFPHLKAEEERRRRVFDTTGED